MAHFQAQAKHGWIHAFINGVRLSYAMWSLACQGGLVKPCASQLCLPLFSPIRPYAPQLCPPHLFPMPADAAAALERDPTNAAGTAPA